MKFYSSENNHFFTEILFEKISAYSFENITFDHERNFSAIVEAVEFLDYEKREIETIFKHDHILARLLVSDLLNIPFYIIASQNHWFYIYQVRIFNGKINYFNENQLTEIEFIKWWTSVKGSNQTHQLVNGAINRVGKSIFHKTLTKYGLMWGGNIDGIIIKDNKVLAVIDNISIAFTSLDSKKADPALFFKKRGPRYETWYSTVKLANTLNVPHILLTFDKNNPKDEKVGITVIDYLSKDGIFYKKNIKPYNNIIYGLESISKYIEKIISSVGVPTLK